MKKMVFSLIFIGLFIGCGSSTNSEESIEPLGENEEISSVVSDNIDKEVALIELTGFSKIQDLIKKSRDGVLSDVTYLCVGDSTRAFSEGESGDYAHLMFERVKDTLDNYSVNSILFARGSQELTHFLETKLENGAVRTPSYQDVIAAIPGTGATTIVDMALGINDLWDLNISSKDDMDSAVIIIKERLIKAIELIQMAKPDINLFLTSPSPLLDWEEGSEVYATVYKEVSSELNLLFINYVDDIMPPRNYDINYTVSEEFQSWYRVESDGVDPIHFSEYGLNRVADYILDNILPKD